LAKKKIKIKPVFKIENIVASASLGVELDLYSIAYKLKNVEYEPEQFPGAILKFQDPKSSLLLFKNGKVICTGAKNEKDVQFTIERTLKLLIPYAKTKPPAGFKPKFTIENIVASAALGVELDLYSIAYKLKNVEYEPEQFPGAILKFLDPKASLLLFKNGKVICTGSKSEKEVYNSLIRAANLLVPFASELPKPKV
jgi:transcription initiation factor TFIID TATA-box-binding protein